jgi:TonB family protein
VEAEVKRIFPTIYHGKVSYFSKEKDKPVQIKYFYNSLEFKPVRQPEVENVSLPDNQTDELPKYPGGINQFVVDIFDHTVLPQNISPEDLKGTFLLYMTVDSTGQQTGLRLVDTEKNGVAGSLLAGCRLLTVPWKPAVFDGKNTNYAYVIPFLFSVDDQAKDADPNRVLMVAEKMPEYPGGELQLRKDIAMSVRYPVDAQRYGKQGKVFVSFIVDTEGNVRNVHVVKSVDPLLDAEAMRVVKLLPRWKPGEQDGKRVCVSYTVPINFVLTKSSPFNGTNRQFPGRSSGI